MSGLTTAHLNAIAKEHAEGRAILLDRPRVADLIAKARLQVALDELPLPEGWHVSEIRRMRSLANVVCWRVIAIGPGPVDFSESLGPTMLEAVLALGDALRSRT